MALTHNSKLAENEPSWGSVDKRTLPDNASANDSREYPHHWVKGGKTKDKDGHYTDGEMFLHRGGLGYALAYAHGARSGDKASSAVTAHLNAHKTAIGASKSACDVWDVGDRVFADLSVKSAEISDQDATQGIIRNISMMRAEWDRDWEWVDVKGLDFTNYDENPVLLWMHMMHAGVLGKTFDRVTDGGVPRTSAQFDLETPFAAGVFRQYRKGFLKAFSLCFIAKDIELKTVQDPTLPNKERIGRLIKHAEVVDLSATPVGANRGALLGKSLETDREDLDDIAAILSITTDLSVKRVKAKTGKGAASPVADVVATNGEVVALLLPSGAALGLFVGTAHLYTATAFKKSLTERAAPGRLSFDIKTESECGKRPGAYLVCTPVQIESQADGLPICKEAKIESAFICVPDSLASAPLPNGSRSGGEGDVADGQPLFTEDEEHCIKVASLNARCAEAIGAAEAFLLSQRV